MVEFLRTNAVSSKIDEIIIEAKEKIILVSPYLDIPKILHERLLEKADDGISITLIYGKTELADKQIQLLKKIKNISIYFLENLHAKCYLNEDCAILTSMNLYDFSQKNNREMGIFCSKSTSSNLYNDIHNEVNSIIKASAAKFKPTIIEPEVKISKHFNSSFNQRLLVELKALYPDLLFSYKQEYDMIECPNFGQYFNLKIEPKKSYYRINFTIAYDVDRKMVYDTLYLSSSVIEKTFPKGVVNWGNQMKRIKLDFPLSYPLYAALPTINTIEYLDWVRMSKELFEKILNTSRQ